MYGYLSVENNCSKMRTSKHGCMFQDALQTATLRRSQFSRTSLSENCGLRGTDIFRKIETVVVYYASNILQYAWKKCLRTADCVHRGMISLGCFLVRLNDKKKTFPFFCNNQKTFSHVELNLKRRLIIVDVRFENWGISIRWYSRISSSFSGGIFCHVQRLDHRTRAKILKIDHGLGYSHSTAFFIALVLLS